MNLALLHEAIAAEIPDRDCIVHRGRRLSWSEVTDRTRRLGALLQAHGLGCHRDRAGLAGWESGQDHVALYLYNGPEYLEGMLGAYSKEDCCSMAMLLPDVRGPYRQMRLRKQLSACMPQS